MPGSRRLLGVMAAGLVDSLVLSVGWTLLLLHVTAIRGLAGAGVCSAALLVGVAMSAPVAGRAAARLDGRALLRCAAATEALLRAAVAALVLGGAPLVAVAVAVALLNAVAFTGYAGMRAEVVACRPGPAALTWYGTLVVGTEAAGASLAALLPVDGPRGSAVVLAAMSAYVLGLLPQAVVAGRSPVGRSTTSVPGGLRLVASMPVLSGGLLMLLGSAPSLLAVALTEERYGRAAVPVAAIAFTAGSLLAPVLAGTVERRGAGRPALHAVCAAAAVAGWTLAPVSLPLLCAAQLLSGACLPLLEGLLDGAVSRRHPDRVTGALAVASAGRAIGSAAGTAALPAAVAGAGLSGTAGAAAVVLLLTGGLAALRWRRHTPIAPELDAALHVLLAEAEQEAALLAELDRRGHPLAYGDLLLAVVGTTPTPGWEERKAVFGAAFGRLNRAGVIAPDQGADGHRMWRRAAGGPRSGEAPRRVSSLPPVPAARPAPAPPAGGTPRSFARAGAQGSAAAIR